MMKLPTGAHSPTEAVLQPSSALIPEDNPQIQTIGVFAKGGGLCISVVAPHATAMDFCVIEESDSSMWEQRFALRGPVEGIWHGFLPGFSAGTQYGFRAFGPWDPDEALYFNPNQLLIDPYARGLTGSVSLGPSLHAHQVDPDLYPSTYPMAFSSLNSALHVPRSVVVENLFPVVPSPRIPWNKTVIYELHVKGFTINMPGVPPELQGTYAGLAHPASVAYLKDLGITSVELLPIMAKMDEPFLTERGLTNYWGYSTLNYFTPEPSYATKSAQASGPQAVVDEFKGMVSLLHEAGIEVLLDVVYNHTCEGGDTGPTVSWRGLDSLTYYRYTDERPRRCIDDTGCGNTVNFSSERVVQMTLDSLRYWVTEMGVDGFRFDLAVTSGRLTSGFTSFHPFFVALAADPQLRNSKVIAEPWDIGPGGWQTGNFPVPFSEWNDRYRDSVRSFWLSDLASIAAGRAARGAGDLATRLSGSSDLFSALRGPRASLNFVTAHDGFTMADLTSFDHKHNLANLEDNRDGTENNRSWNHGVEGNQGTDEITDPTGMVEEILYARERSRRNLMATLLVSAGTPMLVAGDEFSRSQDGNNNAYCQDSPISWVDWNLQKHQQRQLKCTRYLLALRKLHPVFRPQRFATGSPLPGDTLPDISWFSRDSSPLESSEWSTSDSRVFQMRRSGIPHDDADLLVVFNAELSVTDVTLPDSHGSPWVCVYDTSWMHPRSGRIHSAEGAIGEGRKVPPGKQTSLEPQSMQIYLAKQPD